MSYVLATRRNDNVFTTAGRRARADELIAALPRAGVAADLGRRRGARPAGVRLGAGPDPAGWQPGRGHWLLARRSLQRPGRDRLLRLLRAAPSSTWSTWPGSPAPAGRSRSASSRPRTRPGWTSTRCAPGGPGTPTSPCRCSPWPGSPPPAPRPQKGNRHQRPGMIGYTLPEIRRLLVHDPARSYRPGACLVLVPLAPKTPTPGPHQPLQATRLRTRLAAQH